MTNILFVGAHPDDVELGCGGVIAKHLEDGDKVYILIMTIGDRGRHTPNLDECYQSLRYLGIEENNIIFGNFKDTHVPYDGASVDFIEELLRKHDINIVYAHYPEDTHQDHLNCSKAVSAAARPRGSNSVNEIYLYESPSTKKFEPHIFMEISEEHLQKKINALKCYKTQIEKGIINIEAIQIQARLHSIKHKSKNYMEAFAPNHILKRL